MSERVLVSTALFILAGGIYAGEGQPVAPPRPPVDTPFAAPPKPNVVSPVQPPANPAINPVAAPAAKPPFSNPLKAPVAPKPPADVISHDWPGIFHNLQSPDAIVRDAAVTDFLNAIDPFAEKSKKPFYKGGPGGFKGKRRAG